MHERMTAPGCPGAVFFVRASVMPVALCSLRARERRLTFRSAVQSCRHGAAVVFVVARTRCATDYFFAP